MSRLLQAALAAVMVVFLLAYGGKIEGQFFPVSGDTVISRVDAVDNTHVRVWGTGKRLRNCQFHSIEFRLGRPGKSAVADIRYEEGTKVRPAGAFNFGPWVIQLTEDQLTQRSFAKVFHRCHPLWLTESHFYP